MTLLWVILILLLLPIGCFVPGFYFIRKLRWSGSEKLSGSIVLSLILIYLAATAIYLTNLNWKWSWLGTGICVLLAWHCRRDLRGFLGRAVVRRQLLAFAVLWAMGLLALAVIQHYSGGLWAGDWIEHYQRTLFFAQRLPFETRMIDGSALPSRPPMMHLIAAYFLAGTPLGFDLFQVVSQFLNGLALFPCALMAGLLSKQGGRHVWLVAAFLATSPVYMQNMTWTWNKEMTALFVIFSLAMYLRGWQNNSRLRINAAAIGMAAAILTHYSAGPYAMFLFLHYSWVLLQRHRKFIEPLTAAGAAVVLMMTWFAWSIAIYGFAMTFESNTTVADASKMGNADWLLSIAQNFWSTLIPHALRISPTIYGINFDQPNKFGYVRDYFFNLFHPNLLLSFGLIAWAILLHLTFRGFRSENRSMASFWKALICVVVPISIAVHSTREELGVAHVCLQPLVLIGRVFLAAQFLHLAKWLRWVLCASLPIDAALGIVLQFRMEMIAIAASGSPFHVIPLSSELLSSQAVSNSVFRFRDGYVLLADHFNAISGIVMAAFILLLASQVLIVANAASFGRATPWRKPSFKGAAVLGIFFVASALCMMDRIAGFNSSNAVTAPASQTEELFSGEIQPLKLAGQANPEYADLYYELGVTCYRYGKLDQAAAALGNALLLNPNHAKAQYLYNLIVVAYQFPLDPADPVVPVLYHTYQSDEPSYLAYGLTLSARGFKTRATVVLTDVVHRYPNNAKARAALGRALLETGRVDEAIAQCETALRMLPNSEDMARNLRYVLAAAGQDTTTIDQKISQIRKGG